MAQILGGAVLLVGLYFTAQTLTERGFYAFNQAFYASYQERRLRPDIQAVLTVLSRRTRTYENGDPQRLHLQCTHLQHADLRGAQLQGAILEGAQLQAIDRREAYLQHVIPSGAELQDALLSNVQLQEADLRWANLQGTYLLCVQLHVHPRGPCHERVPPGSSRLCAIMSPDPKPSRSKKDARTTSTKPAAWSHARCSPSV